MFKQPVYHSERFAPEKMRVLDPKGTVHRVLARMTNDVRLTNVLHKGLKCLINFEFVVEEIYRSVHTHAQILCNSCPGIKIDKHIRRQQQHEQYFI
jgi:hypothetical protein